MNDEIKEILDIMKKCYDLKDENFDNYITLYQLGLLLDYITNLQQDMTNYVDIVLYQRKTIDNLQQENERLKETNVYCNRTDCIGRIKDSRKYDSVYQEKEDYKSHCEKASEKSQELKDSIDKSNFDGMTKTILILGINQIQNILQNGSDSQ